MLGSVYALSRQVQELVICPLWIIRVSIAALFHFLHGTFREEMPSTVHYSSGSIHSLCLWAKTDTLKGKQYFELLHWCGVWEIHFIV